MTESKIDAVENELDQQICCYNRYNDKHPMLGVSFDKSNNKYVIRYSTLRTNRKKLNDACNFIVEFLDNINNNHFDEDDIVRKLLKNNNCILIKYIYNKKAYYDIQHILLLLSIKKSYWKEKYNEVKNKISGYFWSPNEYGGFIMRELINLKTVKLLIKSTHTHSVINLAKLLDIELLDFKVPRKETTNSNKIVKVFKNEKIIPQQPIGPYRVDLYFPDYKLAIECDEHEHADRDSDYEKKRQKFIERKLGATFLRFNPDDPNFDIFNVISEIHIFIINSTMSKKK